jgi:hypothetical protein
MTKPNTRLDSKVEVTAEDLQNALRQPKCFIDFSHDDRLYDTWSLRPVIRTRDSGLLDQSNAAMLIAHLESDPSLADDGDE